MPSRRPLACGINRRGRTLLLLGNDHVCLSSDGKIQLTRARPYKRLSKQDSRPQSGLRVTGALQRVGRIVCEEEKEQAALLAGEEERNAPHELLGTW